MPKEGKKEEVYVIKGSSKKNKKKTKEEKKKEKELEKEIKKEVKDDAKLKKDVKEEIKNNVKKDDKKEEEEENIILQMPETEEKSLANMEEIKLTMKSKNKIPKEEKKKINKVVFHNILVGLGIALYFSLLILGFKNIKNEIYVMDLKVFGMCSLFLGIILIEKAYNKEIGKFAVYGVEMIFIAVATIALIYVNLIISEKYMFISLLVLSVFVVYYIIKSISIYFKLRKAYFVNNMKKIIKEDDG